MGQPGPDEGAAGLVDPRLEDQEEGGLVEPSREGTARASWPCGGSLGSRLVDPREAAWASWA